MKSIEDTLKTIEDIIKTIPANIEVALIGGFAAILHGVERTTLDIDFCVYSSIINAPHEPSAFYNILIKHLPERFEARFVKGSSIPDDPLKHDIIFINDRLGEFLRIDLLMARYKWELEAIHSAVNIAGISVPVITKPYLAAMKLRSSGYKDAHDIEGLFNLMSEEEKAKTIELAKRIGRDQKLYTILTPLQEKSDDDLEEEII